MNREEMISKNLDRTEPWDMLVVGGGATGAGIAVDARSRGYDLLLLEQSDFGNANRCNHFKRWASDIFPASEVSEYNKQKYQFLNKSVLM